MYVYLFFVPTVHDVVSETHIYDCENMIYFDNAATSAYKPFSVKKAILRELNHSANPGRSSHAASLRAAMIVSDCREEIQRRFFSGNVIFTKNCTEALNLAIFGCPKKGAVVTTVFEHNSVLRPLKKTCDENHRELRVVSPENGDIVLPLLRAIKNDAKLVVVTAMSNVTGGCFPVAEIAKKVKERSDALIVVDMAQAAGHVRVDLSDVDLCAFAGHKGLLGPQGTGFLLCRERVALTPLLYGGTGSHGMSLTQPFDLPDGQEAGTLNTVGIAGLREGIKFVYDRFDVLNKRREKVFNALTDGLRFIRNIRVLAAENGIVTMNFASLDCAEGADRLDQYGVCVRAGLHCAPLAHKYLGTLPEGAIRFSVGVDNTVSEVETALEVVEKIAHTRPVSGIY